jgi:nucleoside-diphosphate-sugar epimerase
MTQNIQIPESYKNQIRAEADRVLNEIKSHGLQERKILLIGGAGYVGSVLAARLLKLNYKVRVLDCLIYRHQHAVMGSLVDSAYEFMFGNMGNERTLDVAFEGVTDIVILGGLVGDPITKQFPEASENANVTAIQKIYQKAEQSKLLNKVVFISSCSNYGLIPESTLADEDFELRPLSLYAKAKVGMEQELISMKNKAQFSGSVLRFATAFGLSPRMRFDLTINEFVREMHSGKELLVFDAKTWRPYAHVQDLSTAVIRLLEAPRERVHFEVFNTGGDANNYTKQMVVDCIRKYLPEAPVRYQGHGADPRNYRVDFRKIRETLYFQPEVTVDDGVREILTALKQKLFKFADQEKTFHGNYEIYFD